MSTTAVKERPILFSAPMVRAILAGEKTQTRRIIKPSNAEFGSASREFFQHCRWDDAVVDPGGTIYGPGPYLRVADHGVAACERCREMGWAETSHRLYPGFVAGERLWVRETFVIGVRGESLNDRPWKAVDPDSADAEYGDYLVPAYRATEPDCDLCDPDSDDDDTLRWKPSIHMPRWASRITLEITEVRAQRLQEISAKDILAEGAVLRSHHDEHLGKCPISAFDNACYPDLKSLWASGWNKINGKESWQSNPWVWAITFKRI